ncbi:chromosome segregation protein SMC [Rhizobiaceae bacterium n13]|uniref:Chromosome partition protein Smc n=1 Tax=Ferirhizobium litorale TaxID=2927786 RepID=A0AAE3QE29_9HYPH|nr:chromosome segregation protein SMC [Fererhizobium litorale]MDI7861397.1 chromosome segregation protein SMC [Fererhizobium litorale]MDI7921544.1 chromosome segregation protein SMC [Fererhizobium litorale]
MKFNKLRVLGFKSFVEPSEFVIERGLTGVVGPNGCGKSNLVEALRWVMGENSYKNMRASGMDDVIFSGSGNRPARNTAEVGLYLDNSDRTAPAAFNDSDEIQVTRRIEREQGSVYRINGKEARAKDVQLLFADASTGARSPSMVGQGRIGELIQAKPQARRQLLEEAAGISGLHSRRHEAELRLRGAETNLERLDDVTSQLESQIESLKRQARQANRFKMLSADIRSREAMLLHIRWVQSKEAEGEADSALNQATVLVAEKAQAQMEAAKAQAIASLKLPELRENEARFAAALQRLQFARTQLEEDANRILRRRDELTRRLAQLGEDIRREERMVADNAAILAKLDAEEAEIEDILADSGRYSEESREAFEQAAARLAESEKLFASLTAERAEAAASRNQLERAIRDLSERKMRLERQSSEAMSELAAIDGRIATLPDPDEKRAIVEAAEQAVADAEAMAQSVEQALSEARRAESMARAPVDLARSKVNALETEARTISRMLATGAAGQYAPVADELQVDRGFETALGAALGDDLDSPLDPEAPAYWSGGVDGEADAALPEGVLPLINHVKAPEALARALRQIGIVDAAAAPRLMAILKPGQRLVTRDGAVYRWDGHVTGSEAPSAAALRLAQKNRLSELEGEIDEARSIQAEAEDMLAAAAERIRREEAGLTAARESGRVAGRNLAEARDALAAAERASGDLIRRRDVIAETASQLAGQIEDIAAQDENARIELEDAPDLSGIDLRLQQQQAVVATDRGALAEARARHEGLSRENEARQRRILVIRQERAGWTERAASAENHISTLREREEEAREEALTLEMAPDEFDDKRRALLNELSKAEEARRAAADALAEAETKQREADQKAATALSELAESRERRGRAEERLVSAREKRQESEHRIHEALNVAPHEALRLTGLATMDDIPDPREVERELERLKMERERLGAVNLRAEEEQKELSEKLETLIRERDDVIDAIRKLRAAIQSLNREGRERLIAAFDVVNAQFQRLFTHLFGGGTAELQLIESDDPLEAGLEILARPPGKKPQTMTLLSGGEQALTAMALIFAVFLTNPAPICVLDEVDAPLDDHNVERYCNLMDEMAASTETRFVVITHNPITMARMNRLFGVTMAEQGVSQLVSVDLQTAERMRDAG